MLGDRQVASCVGRIAGICRTDLEEGRDLLTLHTPPRLARRQLAGAGPRADVVATSLLHEAYLDMARREGAVFRDVRSAKFYSPICGWQWVLIRLGLPRRARRASQKL